MSKKLLSIAFVFVLILCGCSSYKPDENVKRIIKGTYSAENKSANETIQFSFFESGKFEEYINSKLVDSGQYTKDKNKEENENDGFILKSKKKDNEYFILEEGEFYYYLKDVDPIGIYKFERIGDVPVSYNQGN